MAIPVAALVAAKEGSEMLSGVINMARERSESMEPRQGTKAEETFLVDRLLDILDPENTMNLKANEATAHREATSRLGNMNNIAQKEAVQKALSLGMKSSGPKGPSM